MGETRDYCAIPHYDLETPDKIHRWKRGAIYSATMYEDGAMRIADERGEVSYTAEAVEQMKELFTFVPRESGGNL